VKAGIQVPAESNGENSNHDMPGEQLELHLPDETPDTAPEPVTLFAEKPGEPTGEDIRRPAWAVILISLWILGFYAAFYYFLIAHRFESFAPGG
jgi:hypothetical protein